MTTVKDLQTTYQQIIDTAKLERKKVQNKILHISTLRTLIFILGAVAVIYFGGSSWALIIGIISATIIPFACLMKYHNRLFYRRDYLDKKIEINQQEIAALNDDHSAFEDGKEFVDPSHYYTYDLDVFGTHSLFQCLNRTSSLVGKKILAYWLKNNEQDTLYIQERQQAVMELGQALKFRQRFRVLGSLYKGKDNDEDTLTTWTKTPTIFNKKLIYKLLPTTVTAINAVCIAGILGNFISASLYGSLWIIFILLSSYFTNRITRVQASTNEILKILSKYTVLLQLIEQQPVKAKLLTELKKNTRCSSDRQASEAIQKLKKLMNALDQRNNIFMYMILNGCFFWELRQMIRIEQWKEQYADYLPKWMETIGEMDALNSLATFAYNHPDYTYPTLSSEDFHFEAKDLGHPMMPRKQCVKNDLTMIKRPYFIIITGANMAGKSTYLRTIGTNYLLACTGLPVCASSMTLSPKQLITSLRTSDSLNENESYFFAELKRLKMIIDKLKAGEELFIILDEILKGTNSMDKQKGSDALIRQFIALKANGIIATHDLLLGQLINQYPDHISNYCFEADITNDELTFSYKLRSGVAQNMNACFLMKKMGIAIASE